MAVVPEPQLQRPPGWRFDFAAADEAAHQLELTAQALLQAIGVMEHDIPVITEDWRGRFREVFDVTSGQHDMAARALANDMIVMAASIRAKAVEAAAAWVP
jgi:hypothetical protein